MTAFVHRTSELDELTRWWRDPALGAALVWGRRRVGKTALVQRFTEMAAPGRTLFHTGAGRPRPAELQQLSRAVPPALLGVRDVASRPFADVDDLLDHLAREAQQEPVLLVLDEYPELLRSFPELSGVLRAFLDRPASRGVRLLLCGSAVRSMAELQEERAPLFGRFGLRLQLHPFAPHEVSALLPGMPPAQRAQVYALLGGMPLYLSWWDAEDDLAGNLRRLATRPGGLLLTEGDLLLATEVERGDQPAAVLAAIATGKTKHHEIKSWIGAEPTRTLERLIEMRLVERIVPVTDDVRRSRRRSYRIADNFLAFHLGLLGRFRPEIERGLGESILPVLIDGLDDASGLPWEVAVRDHVRRLAAQGAFGPEVVAVGPWWRGDGADEIDVVALAGRQRRPVLVGEVTWRRDVDGDRLVRSLRVKAAALDVDPEDLQFLVAGRDSVTFRAEAGTAITAADVFA
ncbi:ATP-binding protein [Kineococcus sp. R8]|uniref:ATP-binding protein n=1 Tax=Kineococcus siccus TaxID=2696567 RepID=UPI00141223B3|nr:DUF234 domain-containing protein [Kineococcus siccus]NAZ80269.1 ATP-binding protein [Kineococcus siccus]